MPRSTIEELARAAEAVHGGRPDLALEADTWTGRCIRTRRVGLLRVLDGAWAEQWAPVGADSTDTAIANARRLCGPCPAQGACLLLALREAGPDDHLIRGGTTASERLAYVRAQRSIQRAGSDRWAVAA